MEVHTHSHTVDPDSHRGRKKWTHYLLEFLMLFLAVFCGFLAENFREHKIEQQRARELAISFYDELKNDSVNVAGKYQNRVRLENSLLYLRKYFRDSSMNNVSKTFAVNFYNGVVFRSPTLFEPRTVVLEQLKNSGSLRYFKSNELQKLIGDISVAIYNVNDRQALESSYRGNYITPLLIKHLDSDFESKLQLGGKNMFENIIEYEKKDTIIPFKLKKLDVFDAEEADNILGLFAFNCRGTRTIQFQQYTEVNAALLKELRKQYHLK